MRMEEGLLICNVMETFEIVKSSFEIVKNSLAYTNKWRLALDL